MHPKCTLVFGSMALDNGVSENIDELQVISVTHNDLNIEKQLQTVAKKLSGKKNGACFL